MAKDTERNQARILYIDQCLTAKEISERLKVSEKTVGNWVDIGNWKDLRISKQSGTDTLIRNYNELLSLLIEKRLRFEKQKTKTDEEKAEHAGCIDEISKISAAIDRLHKDGKVSLRIHIHCLEKFSAALRNVKPELFTPEFINFQSQYLDLLADELK